MCRPVPSLLQSRPTRLEQSDGRLVQLRYTGDVEERGSGIGLVDRPAHGPDSRVASNRKNPPLYFCRRNSTDSADSIDTRGTYSPWRAAAWDMSGHRTSLRNARVSRLPSSQ